MGKYNLRYSLMDLSIIHAAYMPGTGAQYPSTACDTAIYPCDRKRPDTTNVTCKDCLKAMAKEK